MSKKNRETVVQLIAQIRAAHATGAQLAIPAASFSANDAALPAAEVELLLLAAECGLRFVETAPKMEATIDELQRFVQEWARKPAAPPAQPPAQLVPDSPISEAADRPRVARMSRLGAEAFLVVVGYYESEALPFVTADGEKGATRGNSRVYRTPEDADRAMALWRRAGRFYGDPLPT